MGRRNVKSYLEFILVENIKGPYFPLVDNVLLYSLKINDASPFNNKVFLKS